MEKNFSLEEVKGQEKALSYLKYFVKHKEKIPPLLIFHGPESTGKWFAAERFARHMLCLTGDSCGHCMSCKLFMKVVHPDYIQFPAGSNIAIGEEKDPEEYTIRWLQSKRIYFQPHLSKLRIVLVPDASLINYEAETAMLKSLEESPDHTRYIFIVDDIKKLKETIRSRGVLIPFDYLPKDAIREIQKERGIEPKNYFGGSIKPYNIPELVIEKTIEQIEERTESSLNLLVLENWILEYKTNHPEWPEDFSYNEFLDFFTLMMINEYTRTDYEGNIRKIEEIFKFKEEMHRHITSLENFVLSKLFHKLMQYSNN